MQAHLLSSEIKKKKKEQTTQRPLILTPTDVSPQVVSVTAVRHGSEASAGIVRSRSGSEAGVGSAYKRRWELGPGDGGG